MKKFVIAAALSAFAIAVPANASQPSDPGSQGKGHGKSKRCEPRKKAYVAKGLFVSHTLTQTKGADTADNPSDDRWSGGLVVDVKRTNKHARADKGTTKTYTLTDVRVRFADRDGNGTPDQPVAGDRVMVQGKITTRHRKCDQTGFTPELTVKRVKFLPPPDSES